MADQDSSVDCPVCSVFGLAAKETTLAAAGAAETMTVVLAGPLEPPVPVQVSV